ADVTQYRIFKRTTSTASAQIATITASGATSYAYTVTGLTKNVKYAITILAWDGFQPSAAVVVWATPKDNIPPAPPTGLAVADVPGDDGKVLKVTFSRSADDAGATPKTTSYGLYRAGSETASGTKIMTITATKATSYQYLNTGLVAGQTYWYRVVAIGPTGTSAATARVSGTPVDNRFVRPPLNLTAADHPYDRGGTVDLSWARSGDDGAGANIVKTYYLYRKMANVQVSPTKIAQVTATAATQYRWSDTAVPLELILYEYTVKAVAANGAMSAAAGPAKAAAEDNNVLVFEPPTGFTVKDVASDAGGQLLLTWTRSVSEGDIGPPPPPPVIFNAAKVNYGGQYEFYRRTATGAYTALPTFTVNVAGTVDPMTYVDSGLTNATRYYYKMRYRRYNQISAFTAEASAAPAKGVAANKATTGDRAGGTLASTAPGLSAALLSPPVRVVAGQNALLGVSVSASGRSAVCLEYAVGSSVARTAAATGNGSYETQLPLRTAGLPAGTIVQVRALVA
ncbi:MAG: fibronectin type III domain-containing protein, partial [Armatimonadota bacterium]